MVGQAAHDAYSHSTKYNAIQCQQFVIRKGFLQWQLTMFLWCTGTRSVITLNCSILKFWIAKKKKNELIFALVVIVVNIYCCYCNDSKGPDPRLIVKTFDWLIALKQLVFCLFNSGHNHWQRTNSWNLPESNPSIWILRVVIALLHKNIELPEGLVYVKML